jgi:hypothetical protein
VSRVLSSGPLCEVRSEVDSFSSSPCLALSVLHFCFVVEVRVCLCLPFVSHVYESPHYLFLVGIGFLHFCKIPLVSIVAASIFVVLYFLGKHFSSGG